MKNLILAMLAVLFTAFTTEAQTTISWPFGDAAFITDAATDTPEVANHLTYWTVDTINGSTATLHVKLHDELRSASQLYIELIADTAGGATVSFGDNLQAADESLTVDKTSVASFFYDGTEFKIVGIKQID